MAILGRPRKTRSSYLMKALCFLPIPILLGIYLAKYFPLSNLIMNFQTIDWTEGIIHPELTEQTTGAVALMMIIYMFFVWKMYEPDNKRGGQEYGSAGWGDWKKLVRKYAAKENKEYSKAIRHIDKRLLSRSSPKAIKDMKAVTSTNRILSEHMKIDINMLTSKMNANTVVVGASGTNKTTALVYTNIMQASGSMVVCDPKGDVTPRCAGFANNAGFDVKILDLIDMDNSDRFNPFEYVRSDEDIISMVSFCFKGLDTDKSGTSKDPFWDDANMLEIAAVCYLLYYDGRPESRNLSTAMKLVNLNSLVIQRGNQKNTALTWLFLDFEKRHGSNNMPMTYFKMFNKAKDKTLSNIETTLAAKMQMLLQPKVERLMSKDDLKLADIGRKPQMLFLRVPDSNRTYNFIISMVYMFLYKELYKVSDEENMGNGCTVPVTILQDEFATFPQPDNYMDILSGCRSRNIGFIILVQELARLKTMKCLSEGWSAIFGQCHSWVFLGGEEKETNTYFSELLGKETIEVINKKDSTHTGRELATVSELGEMDKQHCIVKLNGQKPVYDTKYPFLQHPNIKLTAIPRDQSGIPFYKRTNNKVEGAKKISVETAVQAQ